MPPTRARGQGFLEQNTCQESGLLSSPLYRWMRHSSVASMLAGIGGWPSIQRPSSVAGSIEHQQSGGSIMIRGVTPNVSWRHCLARSRGAIHVHGGNWELPWSPSEYRGSTNGARYK